MGAFFMQQNQLFYVKNSNKKDIILPFSIVNICNAIVFKNAWYLKKERRRRSFFV